ncbi:hypothetical protein ACFCXP_37640 [Streptomyces niveus]|uniref:hypothetical protein n=1 Tax=Streptomyces niveus TaxID=193462 RepID=UPI0035DB4274
MTVAELRAALADLPGYGVVMVSVDEPGEDFATEEPVVHLDYRAGVLTLDTA